MPSRREHRIEWTRRGVESRRRWTSLLLVAAAGIAIAAAAAVLGRDSVSQATPSGEGPYRGSEPPGRHELPPFRLRNHDGRSVRSSDLRGRVVVLTFLDSQCTEACPIVASQIGRAVARLSSAERDEVRAVAISTDPVEDTPASVRTFLERQGVLGSLLYLGGSEREMRTLWRGFQILSSLESGKDALHSAPVRVYSRDGVWVATLHAGADLTPENLAADVRVALRRSQ